MDKQLTELLEKHNAQFNWNAGEGTWCLSGVDKGNAWETDDYKAEDRDQAEGDAVDYLIAYNE